jgi:hypothetical protein
MVFVKYDRQVKVIVVNMARRGVPLAQINDTIDRSVSPDSLSRWMHIYNNTRDVLRDPMTYEQRGRPLAISPEEADFIMSALDLEPTLFIDEIQSHLQAMAGNLHPLTTITDELRVRLQLTKKTARTVHPAQCPFQRAEFTERVGAFRPNYFVFMGKPYSSLGCPVDCLAETVPCVLDEAAVSLGTHSRDRAWARRGRRTKRIPRPLAAPRITVLPAVSLQGMLGVIAHQGSMRRVDVEYFIEEVLVSSLLVIFDAPLGTHPAAFLGQMPVMGRFPGPNSVLVLDNAAVHHGGRVREICETHGVLLVYLPPYSPDMNPIEKVFSVLKSRLKRAQILTGTDEDTDIVMNFLSHMVTPELMESLFLGSGYSA